MTALAVLGPAGMIGDLARGLGVSVGDTGLLMSFGAIVICIASPTAAWLTCNIDRRRLLTGTLVFISAAHLASALAPNYTALLAIRLVMLMVAALFTPQAAATAALMAPKERRGSTVSFIFLGWSTAIAVGLPAIGQCSHHVGWRATYGAVSVVALLAAGLAWWRLPSGHAGVRVRLKTWCDVARNRFMLAVLVICMLQMTGQFVIFPFIGPLMTRRMNAGPETIALLFLTWGATAFLGNLIASRVIDSWGSWKTALWSLSVVLGGILGWTIGGGGYPFLFVSFVVWGLGFASANSTQQVRLAAAAPELASASIALATSSFYVGQALGAAVGGALFECERFGGMDVAAITFVGLALALTTLTRPGTPSATTLTCPGTPSATTLRVVR